MDAISVPFSLSLKSIWVQLKQLKLGFNVKIWLIWSWCKSGESTHFLPTRYSTECPVVLDGHTHRHTHTQSRLWETLKHEEAKVFNWSLGSNSLSLDIRKQRFREARNQVFKLTSRFQKLRGHSPVSLSFCLAMWHGRDRSLWVWISVFHLPTKRASLSQFPPLKWGQASSTPQAGRVGSVMHRKAF